MGQEKILKILEDFGLSQLDSQVYLFLTKKGEQKGKNIIKALRINRPQLYRSLKSLQSKGIVSSTLQYPARFSAIPFEEVLNRFILSKMQEAQSLEKSKKEILAQWQSAEITENVGTPARFMVIETRTNVYSKVLQMITETRKRFVAITTVPGLVRAENYGLFDAVYYHEFKKDIQFKFLTELSKLNLQLMKTLLLKKENVNLDFKVRSIDFGLKLCPRLAIRDEEEIIFFITSNADTVASEQEDVGLWTDSKTLVNACNIIFEDMWKDSTDIYEKLLEVETGKSPSRTHIFRDAETARKKYLEIVGSAKEEITILTQSRWVNTILEEQNPFLELRKRGVLIRLMAPISKDSIDIAEKLSDYADVRYVSSKYPRTTLIDGKHVFLFKTPLSERDQSVIKSFEDAFYSNESGYLDIMKGMLNDIWNDSRTLSELTVGSVYRSPVPTVNPSESVSTVAEIMVNQDIGAIVVAKDRLPIGIITEKDIMQRVVNARKDPTKTFVKDIMSHPLITIDYRQTSQQALELMRRHKIRRLAVIKDEKLSGLLTERRALSNRD